MTALELTEVAISANRDHQQDILDFASECQTRIKAVDSLLKEVEKLEAQKKKWKEEDGDLDSLDSDEDPAEKGEEIVYVKGAWLASGPTRWVDLRADDSPFRAAFDKAEEHRIMTTPRPWTSKESAALRVSLQTELRRSVVIDAKARGVSVIAALGNFDPEAAIQDVQDDQVQWDNVAKILQNESAAKPPRTGAECRLQWMTIDSPAIDREEWDEDEQMSLIEDVRRKLHEREKEEDRQPGLDWDEIVQEHNEKFETRRTIMQCLRVYRASLTERPPQHWTEEEDKRLQVAVTRFGNSWVQVAKYVGHGRTSRQARVRWQTLHPVSDDEGK